MKLIDFEKAKAALDTVKQGIDPRLPVHYHPGGGGRHLIHLLDPLTGDIQRRVMGSDYHLGAVED